MSKVIVTLFAGLFSVYFVSAYAKKSDSTEVFVEIIALDDTIIIDLPYSTSNNVFSTRLYPVERAFLRKEVAEHLVAAHRSLEKYGLGIKVWDAYRPRSVQYKMWEISPRPGYVGNPDRGSKHNRGAAVDVTLVHLATGIELPMPTPYDEFSPRAHANDFKLEKHIAERRTILQKVMRENGFKTISTEWWHFDFVEWEKFPLEEILIEDLAKLHPRSQRTDTPTPEEKPGITESNPDWSDQGQKPSMPSPTKEDTGLPKIETVTRDRKESSSEIDESHPREPEDPAESKKPAPLLRAVPIESEE